MSMDQQLQQMDPAHKAAQRSAARSELAYLRDLRREIDRAIALIEVAGLIKDPTYSEPEIASGQFDLRVGNFYIKRRGIALNQEGSCRVVAGE